MAKHFSRREILAASIAALAALPGALPGCSPPSGAALDRRLIASLRDLVGKHAASGHLTASTGLAPADALAELRGDLSDAELLALASDPQRLRAYLARRSAADFEAGRTRSVDGWQLARSELATAVLLGM